MLVLSRKPGEAIVVGQSTRAEECRRPEPPLGPNGPEPAGGGAGPAPCPASAPSLGRRPRRAAVTAGRLARMARATPARAGP